jgi:phenylacetate-CoA ligase
MPGMSTAIRKFREYRQNERLSRAELETHKLGKFRSLVRHAVERSAYYREIVASRNIDVSTCTPADFPVLTKTDLMTNFDRIVTDPRITKQGLADFLTRSKDPGELFLNRYRVMHTSGSSGQVGYFVYGPDDWMSAFAQGARRRGRTRRMSVGFRRARMAFLGATDGHYTGVTMARMAQQGLTRLLVKVAIYEINDPLAQTIAGLNAFQPDMLVGYNTALKILAAKQRSGELRISPSRISSSGESMTENDKAELNAAFGAEVFNGYACTEHLMMGVSGPNESDMVLYDDDLIYEFYEDHTLITNLFNYTMPLIRYRMSDVLRPKATGRQGLPYLVVDNLVGRTEVSPQFVNEAGVEDFISPHTINEIFVSGVERFQMHLLDKRSFRFLVCLSAALDQAQRRTALDGVQQRLREILARKGMSNVSFEVAVVDDLPVDPKTRKFRLIVAAPATPLGNQHASVR